MHVDLRLSVFSPGIVDKFPQPGLSSTPPPAIAQAFLDGLNFESGL
jgi:hypothetical protein